VPEDDLDARVLAELERLSDKQATVTELKECPALLGLLPIALLRQRDTLFGRASAYRRLLAQFSDAVYGSYRENQADPEVREVLAVGALMGLVTQGPNEGLLKPTEMRKSVGDRESRQHTAGSWLLNPLQPRTVRANRHRYLVTFQHSLYEYLEELSPSSPSGLHLIDHAQAGPGPEAKPKKRRRKAALALSAGVTVLAVSAGVLLQQQPWHDRQDKSSGGNRVTVGSQSIEDKESARAPVKVIAVENMDGGHYSWEFSRPQEFSASELTKISDLGNYDKYVGWFTSKGAVPVGGRTDLLTIEGNSSKPIEINGLQVEKKCTPPLSGPLFDNPNAGSDSNILLSLNLDEAIPTAKGIEADGSTSPSYFTRHTISLKHGERGKILISASTENYYCEYTLKLKITAGDTSLTQVIKDNGKPFKITAFRNSDEEHPYKPYSRAYVGGVLNPCGKGFREVVTQKYSTTETRC
jgi:hypothetical protein